MSFATVTGPGTGPLGRPTPPHRSRIAAAWRYISRRRGLRELAFIAVVYLMYDGSRFIVQGQQATALAHAVKVMHLETLLDMGWDQTVNTFFSAHKVLAVTADYMYATLHYIVTPIVLVWMWRKHRDAYPRARTVLVVATVLGLIGFSLIPVAPPRMLPGFVDTMAQYSGFGWWSGDASVPRGLGSYTNQFAAMPSLHVGWALWCGWQLIRHGQHRLTRISGVAYPALITVVVIGTGNHYLLDAVAGIAVVIFAMLAVGGVARLLPHRVVRLEAATRPSKSGSVDTLAACPTTATGSPSKSSPPAPV